MREMAIIVTVFLFLWLVIPIFQSLYDFALLQHLRERLLAATEVTVYNLVAQLDAVAFSEARIEIRDLETRIARELERELPRSAVDSLHSTWNGDLLVVAYEYPMSGSTGARRKQMRVDASYRLPLQLKVD